MPAKSLGWRTEHIALENLYLDHENPRLPPEMQSIDRTQRELALYINRHYDPLQIAESIARHGFFESEPLIVVLDNDHYKVIEGNRRLTALKALSDDNLREEMTRENSGWKKVPRTKLPDSLPVVIVDDPRSVIPLLGFRHISGIEPWDPYAQARYIARLVDEGQQLDSIADLVGRTRTEVRSMYRDHEILRQAQEQFRLDVTRARNSFGVFNAAMGRVAIRSYIDAPSPRYVDPDTWPLPEDKKGELGRVLTYVFGDARGEGRVIRDSRQLLQLGKVLADSSGRAIRILDKTGSLDDSLDSIADPDAQFINSLKTARKNMERAMALQVEHVEPVSMSNLKEIDALVARLLALPLKSDS